MSGRGNIRPLTPEREAEIRVIAKTKGYAKRQEWWDDVAGDLLAEIDRLRGEVELVARVLTAEQIVQLRDLSLREWREAK